MLNQDYRDILSLFNAEGVEFLVVGAYALAAHGLPRATGDIDLWIRPSSENAARAWRALGRFGAPLDRITPRDLEKDETIFQVGVIPQRVDVMTTISGVEFAEAWAARITVTLDGVTIPVIGRRELLTNKRASGRPQDLVDVNRLTKGGELP